MWTRTAISGLIGAILGAGLVSAFFIQSHRAETAISSMWQRHNRLEFAMEKLEQENANYRCAFLDHAKFNSDILSDMIEWPDYRRYLEADTEFKATIEQSLARFSAKFDSEYRRDCLGEDDA